MTPLSKYREHVKRPLGDGKTNRQNSISAERRVLLNNLSVQQLTTADYCSKMHALAFKLRKLKDLQLEIAELSKHQQACWFKLSHFLSLLPPWHHVSFSSFSSASVSLHVFGYLLHAIQMAQAEDSLEFSRLSRYEPSTGCSYPAIREHRISLRFEDWNTGIRST